MDAHCDALPRGIFSLIFRKNSGQLFSKVLGFFRGNFWRKRERSLTMLENLIFLTSHGKKTCRY